MGPNATACCDVRLTRLARFVSASDAVHSRLMRNTVFCVPVCQRRTQQEGEAQRRRVRSCKCVVTRHTCRNLVATQLFKTSIILFFWITGGVCYGVYSEGWFVAVFETCDDYHQTNTRSHVHALLFKADSGLFVLRHHLLVHRWAQR